MLSGEINCLKSTTHGIIRLIKVTANREWLGRNKHGSILTPR